MDKNIKLPSFDEYTSMLPDDKAAIPPAAEQAMRKQPQFIKDEQAAQHAEIEQSNQQAAKDRAEIVAAGV